MTRLIMASALLLVQLWMTTFTHANVVLSGTRVIFPADAKDQSLQFQNKSNTPFLVQIWLDAGNPDSTPENQDAPFVVKPQVFRLNSNSGQTARLFYSGDGQLPQDRESIFYLNFKQIPALSKDTAQQNKLTMIVNSRFKVFYRPQGISGKVENISDQLNFKLQQDQTGHWIQINNPTGYYANLTKATLSIGEQKIDINDVNMIAPKSSGRWPLKQHIQAQTKAQLKVTLINDYGAFNEYNIRLQP